MLDARVADQDVDVGGQRREGRLVGEVERERVAADRLRDLVRPLAVAVEHGDVRPGGGQPQRAGAADAAGAARHEGASTVQVRARWSRRRHVVVSLPRRQRCTSVDMVCRAEAVGRRHEG